jgi:hypothetical protein
MAELALRQGARADTELIGSGFRFIIEVLCLCVPALINRAPLVYPDTRAYFMGGHTAVEKVAGVVQHAGGGASEANQLEATIHKARGVRSAFYSLFVYLPAVSLSLWVVILLQAMLVAVVLRFVLAQIGNRRGWIATCDVVLLCATSTVAWVTCNVMPDVFTALMALGVVSTLVYWRRLTTPTVIGLFCLIAGSMVMHITNLPIALGLLLVGALIQRPTDRARFVTVAGALALGVAAMLMVGVVGFKQWTIAPQSPPFLTARSVQDGPGKLYLREHCPEVGLDMCQHLDKLDQNTEKFIWDPDGVYSAVSPDEEARLRAEDKRLYLAAALDHPWMQVQAIVHNTIAQLVSFGVYEYFIPSWAEYSRDDMTLYLPQQAFWQTLVSAVVYLVMIAALISLYTRWRNGTLTASQKQFALLVVATVILEAVVGAISEPAPRYEARVMWLIPLCALAMRSSDQSLKPSFPLANLPIL